MKPYTLVAGCCVGVEDNTEACWDAQEASGADEGLWGCWPGFLLAVIVGATVYATSLSRTTASNVNGHNCRKARKRNPRLPRHPLLAVHGIASLCRFRYNPLRESPKYLAASSKLPLERTKAA